MIQGEKTNKQNKEKLYDGKTVIHLIAQLSFSQMSHGLLLSL